MANSKWEQNKRTNEPHFKPIVWHIRLHNWNIKRKIVDFIFDLYKIKTHFTRDATIWSMSHHLVCCGTGIEDISTQNYWTSNHCCRNFPKNRQINRKRKYTRLPMKVEMSHWPISALSMANQSNILSRNENQRALDDIITRIWLKICTSFWKWSKIDKKWRYSFFAWIRNRLLSNIFFKTKISFTSFLTKYLLRINTCN